MINKLETAFSAAKCRPEKIFFYKTTDSTNERAKRYPEERTHDAVALLDGERGFALFIAESQSVGRGRLGRKFISNGGAGLYMSIRFPLSVDMCDAVGITPFAAVAVCRALEGLTNIKPTVKWVNDIYIDGKKLSGILTESTVDELGRRIFVCGIGINLFPSDMPMEVASIATDLTTCGCPTDKYELAARIAEEFIGGIGHIWDKDIINEYKCRSCLIGKRVTVNPANGGYAAKVIGITDRYELTVKTDGGEIKNLSSGEVSIRLA